MFTLDRAAKLASVFEGHEIKKQTIARWITRGLDAHDGRRVYLLATRVGLRYGVERSDLERFLAAVAGKQVLLADQRETAFA